MISLLSMNYGTRFCKFYVDTKDELSKLPTHTRAGEDNLSSVYSCSYGSKAQCSNGKTYILTGNDEWVECSNSSSGSSGGATSNIESIDEEDIDNLFTNLYKGE